MRGKLPEGWVEVEVGEAFKVVGGGTPSRGSPKFWNGDIPWVTSADLEEDLGIRIRRFVTTLGIEESAASVVPAGSVIVATRVGLGKVGLAVQPMTFSQDCQTLIPPTGIDAAFAAHQLKRLSRRFRGQARGTTISGITKKQLLSTDFSIAPLPEQRRIVAKIEELFSELDAGVAALERARAKLERYRASVLKAAVEGRLTEQWRKENPPEETGEVLLKTILTERRKRWEEEQLAAFTAKGKRPPAGWREKYKEPEGPDTSGLPELPEGWCWGTAEQLTDPVRTISYGIVKLGDHDPVGIPTLRSSNVRSLRLDLSFVKRVKRSVSNAYSRTIIRDGDVLVTIRGTLGGVARVPEALGGFNISREVALLAVLDQGLSELLPYFIASPSSQGWVSGNLRGIAYTGINLSDLRFLPIPLPPRSEQVEIVRVLEDIFGRLEQANEALPTLKSRATLLRQSILKLAFEGRLVPQDPNDEPASVLLERIRATRRAAKPIGGRQRV